MFFHKRFFKKDYYKKHVFNTLNLISILFSTCFFGFLYFANTKDISDLLSEYKHGSTLILILFVFLTDILIYKFLVFVECSIYKIRIQNLIKHYSLNNKLKHETNSLVNILLIANYKKIQLNNKNKNILKEFFNNETTLKINISEYIKK